MKTILLICILLLFSITASASDEPPAWLQQAATFGKNFENSRVPAVVLLKEQTVVVNEDGKQTTTERYAVKVLIKEGRAYATMSAPYLLETTKFKEIKGWLIQGSSGVKKYNKESVLDLTAAPNDVYSDVRVKKLDASDDTTTGMIFGYEWTTEEKPLFNQADWHFQNRLPTLLSRFTLSMPSGWRAESVTFNHQKIEPVVSGSTYTWELRDLPPIERESASPSVSSLTPRLAITYFPSSSSRTTAAASFNSWSEVSSWLYQLTESQSLPDETIKTKVRLLIADAKTEIEKIRAIATFVQSVHYISIQTGVGRGGGYRPHSATEVLNKSYGDCKDKANLMKAMLKAAGINSYLLVIYSGDPNYVRMEWPSPQQFNHCIIAVKITENTVENSDGATIVKDSKLGQLLIFDPTDEYTPLGDLPDHEQGSYALVVSNDSGSLLRMPVTPLELNRLEREVEASLGVDGSLNATVREKAFGQTAVSVRRESKQLSKADYRIAIEQWINRTVNGAKVSKIDTKDDRSRFDLEVDFNASRYGQIMQDRLLVFKPAVVVNLSQVALPEGGRKQAVVLDAQDQREEFRIKLPEGFEVDELPDAIKIEAPFGSYKTSYTIKNGYLIYTSHLLVKSAMVGVELYPAAKTFFDKVRASTQAPAVLVRK
ncbi:MAG: DUF3857 domain-containing protein [Blastocatellia bacterium]|nr:DUF3857 domain-containing protein [Blastocatellia bacterium]